jgi:RNA polymerase sigma-54 factor
MSMQLTQSPMLRQDMRTLLTPRMIQSMEILQLPLVALEERIEQEMQVNPVLEMNPPEDDLVDPPDERSEELNAKSDGEQVLVVDGDSDSSADFERLAKLGEYLENEEFYTNSGQFRQASYDGERDRKMDAMNNTAARAITLAEHLLGQWAFVECAPGVRKAGEAIIGYVQDDGYLRTPLEEIATASKHPLTLEELEAALKLVQRLEPAGIGARSVQECLLLQLEALRQEGDPDELKEHDFELERKIITDHLHDLEMNRYPQVSKRLGRSIEQIQAAVKRLGRLHPHPGRQIGGRDAPPITPDATIYFDEDAGRYEVVMANDPAENLSISRFYRKMLKNRECDRETKHFLTNNVRNAKWLIESIEQRKGTIERVIRVVVDAQREFFEKGPEHLKPLPMISVADQLGIHVATVSRAVSEKWIQTPRGVFPLRRFFSGGTTSAGGEDMSWDAVKEKLQIIVNEEDKRNPLGDDKIVEKLQEQGIELARRTVAKYRKILNIPTARQRREF